MIESQIFEDMSRDIDSEVETKLRKTTSCATMRNTY